MPEDVFKYYKKIFFIYVNILIRSVMKGEYDRIKIN